MGEVLDICIIIFFKKKFPVAIIQYFVLFLGIKREEEVLGYELGIRGSYFVKVQEQGRKFRIHTRTKKDQEIAVGE